MGVHGLWQLLHPSGRPVTLESLEGKVLAVDVSIWLHQSMKGMRDKDGNALPNAHLQGLFSRVCKLLFYRIKPVFVFDGGIPDLKKQTLAARRERKSEAQRERDEIGKKLLQNLIKSQAVKQALGGNGGSGGKPVRVPGVRGKGGEKDLFELAPLPESQQIGLALNSEAWTSDFEQQENWIREGLATLSKVDPESQEFKSLPMEIQHEALVDMKEERKFHSLSRISKMPEDADSFSAYQLKKLMKLCNLTTRIEDVRKEMSNKTSVDLRYELEDDYYGNEVEARRIVSEDASHYILIKGLTKEKQMEEAEKYELDRKIKIEKKEEENEEENVRKHERNSKASSSTKRPIQEKDKNYVHRKRLKSDKSIDKRGARKAGIESFVLPAALVRDDDDVEDESDEVVDENDDNGDGEKDDTDSSSSEDEGFIEVTLDPLQAVEEDELFPASIFATASTTPTPSNNTTTITTALSSEPKKPSEPFSSNRNNTKSPNSDGIQKEGKSRNVEKEIMVKKVRENQMKKNIESKKNESSNSSLKSRENTLARKTGNASVVAETVGKTLIETRKNLLSDIMLELQRKKESLNSLSLERDAGGVRGLEGNSDGEDSGLLEAKARSGEFFDEDEELPYDEHELFLAGASPKNDTELTINKQSLQGGKTLSLSPDVNDLHDGERLRNRDNDGDDDVRVCDLPGGFIKEESSSDEEKDDTHNNSSFDYKGRYFRKGSGVEKGNLIMNSNDEDDESNTDDDDEDVPMVSVYDERMNDSEDDDLKLAIELSLQTARQEKGGRSCEDFSGKNHSPSEIGRGDVGLASRSNNGGKRDTGIRASSKDSVGNIDVQVDDNDGDKDGDDDDFEMVESFDKREIEIGHHNTDLISTEVGKLSDKEGEIGTVVSNVNLSDDDHEEEEKEKDDDNNYNDDEAKNRNCDEIAASVSSADIMSPFKLSSSTQERFQPEDVDHDQPFADFQQNGLGAIQEELQSERAGLLSEQGRQDRFATSLTDQIILEAQDLLKLFGIPYVVCPMEAEAQCAFLDATRQTQGTITDDSDIWLFGGTRVYKNFFNQNKLVEFFSMDSIKSHFDLTREELIKIAILCGSDYTTGIQGVGPVRALEILGEFTGDGLSGLIAFRKWWDKRQKKLVIPGESKLRTRLKELSLDKGFPSPRVLESYLCPTVDESRERFSWGQPDLDLLRQFARVKFGWAKDKSDSVLDPMMKQLLKKQSQGRIHSYFQPGVYIPSSAATDHSDRMKKALSVMQRKKSSISTSDGARHDGSDENIDDREKDRHDSDNDGDSDDYDRGEEQERPISAQKRKDKNTSKIGKDRKTITGKKNKKIGINRKQKNTNENTDNDSVSRSSVSNTKGHNIKNNLNVKEKEKNDGEKLKKGKKSVHFAQEETKSNSGVREEEEVDSGEKNAVKEERMEADIVIKTEKDDGDAFMKAMQEKVAAASTLLSRDNVSKRGKGGRGGGGKGRGAVSSSNSVVKTNSVKMKASPAPPSLPSATKVRGQRAKLKSSTRRNAALNRGVVCLSESSSSSSSESGSEEDVDDNDDDDDDEDYCDKYGTKIVKTSDVKRLADRNILSKYDDVENSGKDYNVTKQWNAEIGQNVKLVKKPKPPNQQSSQPQKPGKFIKRRQRQEKNKESQQENAVRMEDRRRSALLTTEGNNEGVESMKRKNNDVVMEVEKKKEKKSDTEIKKNSSKSCAVKNNEPAEIEIEKSVEAREQAIENNGEEDMMKIKGDVVGQVPGKNPDVSIINAMTLKATMSYLNQRSLGEKHLLNALGGRKSSNAVERRMEEEDRRGKRLDVVEVSRSHRQSSNSGSSSSIKKKKVDQIEQGMGKQKASFEEMLGGAEILRTAQKPSKANSENCEKSEKARNKTTKSKMELKSKEGKVENVKLSNESDRDGGSRKVETANMISPKSIFKVDGVSSSNNNKSKRVRMKSCSDDSSGEDISTTDKKCHKSSSVGKKEKKSSKEKDVTFSGRSQKSAAFDKPIGFVDEGEGKSKRLSQKSSAFDTPIGFLDEGEGRIMTKKLDKFGLQVSHLSDTQSVRGHGIFPAQSRAKKGAIIDTATPIGGGGGGSNRDGAGGFDGDSNFNRCRSDGGDNGSDGIGDSGITSGDGSASVVTKGRAVAGKGKGIGKNRSGRLNTAIANTNINIANEKSVMGTNARQVKSVVASAGVTEEEIMEYGCMTLDDLGSDFSDGDF